MDSKPEHEFIAVSLDKILREFSRTSLFGITESQRRTFDYSCILLRDFSRPLISQVLWGHVEGIEKDIRTLVHDSNALIKVYVVKDQTRTRARIEEIVNSYRAREETRRLLTGLRILPVPPDFDADKEKDQIWLYDYLESRISRDILFAIVFGQLTNFDLIRFASHGGPLGLKYLILHEITLNTLRHMPTFKERIGYKTTGPIREALTMLSSLGLIKKPPLGLMYFPTVKGRLLLDLTRRLLFELKTRQDWSEEIKLVFKHLGVVMPPLTGLHHGDEEQSGFDPLVSVVYHARYCQAQFGRDLLGDINSTNPKFYSEFYLPDDPIFPNEKSGIPITFFSEPESLLFFGDEMRLAPK